MPTIIIQAENGHGRPAAVTLTERVIPADVQSEHYLGQLVERVGWALVDAEELEVRAADARRSPARSRVSSGEPGS